VATPTEIFLALQPRHRTWRGANSGGADIYSGRSLQTYSYRPLRV